MNSPLRLKIAQYLTAGFASRLKALKEDGVIAPDSPDEERAAEAFLREAATAVLFVADQDETRLKADHAQGDYREAVEKLVAGVVEDIKGCKYPHRPAAQAAVLSAVNRSEYVKDPDLQPVTLTYSTHPSAYHFHARARSPLDPLPWERMAMQAMLRDALEELERSPEFNALPA